LSDPIYGGVIAEVNAPLTYQVEFADRTSEEFSIDVFNHPRLEAVDAVIKPPAYTGLDERVEEDTRYIHAIAGAEIQLRLHINKMIDAGSLQADGHDSVVLHPDPENPNQLIATLTATEKLTYGVHLQDSHGRNQKSVEHILIEVRKNAAPVVKVTFPTRDIEASPIQEVRFAADIQDDIGLEKYGITYTVKGETTEVELGDRVVGADKQSVEHMLPLENHDAKPNDLVSWFFWAEDRADAGRIRRVESDMFFVEVHHFEEIFREGMPPPPGESGQPPMQSEELLKDQKKIIMATWKLKRHDDHNDYTEPRNADVIEIQSGQEQILEKAGGMLVQITDEEMTGYLKAAMGFMETAIDDLGLAAHPETPAPLTTALVNEQKAYEELIKMRGREFQVVRQQQSQSSSSSSSRS
ncbi:MAG: hypothetical protein AAF492_27430, partial [Verrucomicrobiota bacterium]